MNTKRIYLDYAATTPMDKRVSKAMRDFELEFYGNPNSTHREGQNARAKIDFARADIAKFFGALPQEIVFTSGATEANNMAIHGVVTEYLKRTGKFPHVITTLLEHQSVYNTVKELEKMGVIQATYIKPVEGNIRAEDVIAAIKENTALISMIFVSNEIGSVLPIREIGKALFELSPETCPLKPVFHIDAVQATKFYNCNVEKLGCDLLTASAHKIYGPKGIGLLYIKSGTKLQNLTFGGSQEYGKRPGTQNTFGIIGFAKAVELLGSLEDRQASGEKLRKFQTELINQIQKISNCELNGPTGESRTPDNVNFSFYDVDQDLFMTALDLAGIAGSTGSACVSGSSEPSHVIEALGRVGKRPAATLRLTFGIATNIADIKYTLGCIIKIVNQLRS